MWIALMARSRSSTRCLLMRAFDSVHAMQPYSRSHLRRFRCASALDSMRVCVGSEVCTGSDVVGEIESHLTRGVDIFGFARVEMCLDGESL